MPRTSPSAHLFTALELTSQFAPLPPLIFLSPQTFIKTGGVGVFVFEQHSDMLPIVEALSTVWSITNDVTTFGSQRKDKGAVRVNEIGLRHKSPTASVSIA